MIRLIDIPVKALASIAFGGQYYDIMFAVAGSSVLDVQTGMIAGEAFEKGYLYAIHGLGAKGRPFSRHII